MIPSVAPPTPRYEAVLEGEQGDGVLEDRDPVLPAHHGEGPRARDHGVGNDRRVEEDHDRQDDQDKGEKPDDAEEGIPGPLEVDDARPVSPAGDRHVFLPFPGQVPVEEDERDGGGQGAHPHRRRQAVVRGIPGRHDAVDVGRQDVDPPGHADHRGDGEGGEAPDDDERRRGQDRRPQDRQGHPRQRPEVRGPADPGGFLQGDVEGRHRRGDDQVGDGQIQEPLHEDHPLERVDAERRPLPSEDLPQEEVDHPVRRVEEQHPAHREQDVRDHHRDEGDDPEEELEGDVGPGVQVGQKQGQDGGNGGGADGEDDRVDEDLGKRRVGVGLDVLRQREAAEGAQPLAEAPQDEHHDRADREKSDNRDQDRRQDRSSCVHRDSLVSSGGSSSGAGRTGARSRLPPERRSSGRSGRSGGSPRPGSPPRRRLRRRPAIRPFPGRCCALPAGPPGAPG